MIIVNLKCIVVLVDWKRKNMCVLRDFRIHTEYYRVCTMCFNYSLPLLLYLAYAGAKEGREDALSFAFTLPLGPGSVDQFTLVVDDLPAGVCSCRSK